VPVFDDRMPERHLFFPANLIKRAFQPELMYPERPELHLDLIAEKFKKMVLRTFPGEFLLRLDDSRGER